MLVAHDARSIVRAGRSAVDILVWSGSDSFDPKAREKTNIHVAAACDVASRCSVIAWRHRLKSVAWSAFGRLAKNKTSQGRRARMSWPEGWSRRVMNSAANNMLALVGGEPILRCGGVDQPSLLDHPFLTIPPSLVCSTPCDPSIAAKQTGSFRHAMPSGRLRLLFLARLGRECIVLCGLGGRRDTWTELKRF